jgi:hypothetical protein
MALQTEIDALLAEAATQGITISEVLTQVYQRKADQVESDPLFFTPMPFVGDVSPDWDYWTEWVADNTTTMSFELAWNRLWSGFQIARLPTFPASQVLLYMFQLIRILARDSNSNQTLAKYTTKTSGLIGETYLG